MSVLIALDMVTDIVYPDRIDTNGPLVTEVLPVRILSTKWLHTFALQPGHHLLLALVLARAVQP